MLYFSFICGPKENHSKNKIMYFENDVGPGVLHSSAVQQTYNLQIFHTTWTKSTHNQLYVVCAVGTHVVLVFALPVTGGLQVQSRFQRAQMAK